MTIGRREFITLLGGAAAAWPLAARAQQGDHVRRIGVLMGGDENDPLAKTYLSAFTQALAGLGWADGRNVRMDLRWHGDDINRIRALAQELVGLHPDIIVTSGGAATVGCQRETRTIPIVFAVGVDPVASGIVARLDRPGGNITGFARWEATLGGKWLELLSANLPDATGSHHRRRSRRRLDRLCCTRDGPMVIGAARPPIHRRESAGRCRHYRHRGGRACAR
jgi:putative ABC transport system substrate-binding protein